MTHDPDRDDGPIESVGMGVMRCPDCGLIHIALLDDDGGAICELTLGDVDVVRMAIQLLTTVFPTLNTGSLQAAIGAVSKCKNQQH